MTHDIEMAARGLCETFASAYAGAAAVARAIAGIPGVDPDLAERLREEAGRADFNSARATDYLLPSLLEQLSESTGQADTPEWDGLGEVL